MIHVSEHGSGDFRTIQEALSSLTYSSSDRTIYIHKGIYRERLVIHLPHITMIGEDAANTVITYNFSAYMAMPDGMKRGTFRSHTCFVNASDFTAEHLTFENNAGPGAQVGQAPALYVDGNRIVFENCKFLGNTDTLFTGPLPPNELKKYGFVGPKQFAPRINGRHYYKNCYMEGDVDFIFGSATAFFENCELFSKNRQLPINGYVTAASTAEGQTYGYVFENCNFTSNCPPRTVYLGRPWRNFAKTVLINCHMQEHICKEGWHDWDKPEAHSTFYYAEFSSTGEGATMPHRPSWVHHLTKQEADFYARELVLGGDDGWNP